MVCDPGANPKGATLETPGFQSHLFLLANRVHRMNPRLLIHLLLVVLGTTKVDAAEANQAPTVQAHRLPSGVRLTWVAQPNHRYRIETSPALTSGWTHATELLATTSEASWTHAQANPPVPHGFFRILDLGPAPVAGLTADSAFRAADVVPLELTELFDRSGKSALEAIQVATALAPAGGLAITNGTLRLTGSPANPVQYEPLPRDRFVLVPLQGPTVEIYVLFVDFTRGISEWRHVSEGTDLIFRSEPGAQSDRATVRGHYRPSTFPGVAFDVDLAATTSGFSEVDSSGTHTLTDSTMTGRLSTEGFAQTVQTRSRFEFVSVRGISGRLDSSSVIDITPPKLPVLVNGGMLSRYVDKINTRVNARAIVATDGKTQIAIVVADSCMMSRDVLDDAKKMAAAKTGIPADRMLISATHAHSAPASMGCLGTDADPAYVPF
jgi:hypothetical protein